jgi:GTP-dependent phosphoenolpyruvate carboxykinase
VDLPAPDGEVEAVDTPIGRVARAEDLNSDGLDLPAGRWTPC